MAQAENSPFPKPWVQHNAPKSDLITQEKFGESFTDAVQYVAATHAMCQERNHQILLMNGIYLHANYPIVSPQPVTAPYAVAKVIFNILARSYQQDIGTGRHNTFAVAF